MTELKSCPFCGIAPVCTAREFSFTEYSFYVYVEITCEKCGCSKIGSAYASKTARRSGVKPEDAITAIEKAKSKAASAWNGRALEQEGQT